MTIRKASQKDLPFLLSHDRHIAADEIRSVVQSTHLFLPHLIKIQSALNCVSAYMELH